MQDRDKRLVSLPDLETWERRGAPGSKLIYYVGGCLAYDVEYSKRGKKPSPLFANVINRIRDLANLGRVDLAQRRLTRGRESVFAYEAIFRDSPTPVNKEHAISEVIPFVGLPA